MGNSISPCLGHKTSKSSVKLILWDGATRILAGTHVAGEVMLEFPEMMVCHADSFFIGHPVPALARHDQLSTGHTYLVLPIHIFACTVLSASSLAALGSTPNKAPIKFGESPFEYINSTNGVLIKVTPEFITSLVSRGNNYKEKIVRDDGSESPGGTDLCTTPELQKHYNKLVVSKGQIWSPELETISEYKVRFSPCRFIRVGVKKEGEW